MSITQIEIVHPDGTRTRIPLQDYEFERGETAYLAFCEASGTKPEEFRDLTLKAQEVWAHTANAVCRRYGATN